MARRPIGDIMRRTRLKRHRTLNTIAEQADQALWDAWHAPLMDLDVRFDLMRSKVKRAILKGD